VAGAPSSLRLGLQEGWWRILVGRLVKKLKNNRPAVPDWSLLGARSSAPLSYLINIRRDNFARVGGQGQTMRGVLGCILSS
jgi:hypothetical protein